MSSIQFEIKNNIGYIQLNRPEKYNAFNREMALLMQQKLDACKSQEVRCVLITGIGKAFSAGQDLEEITRKDAPSIGTILSEHYNPIIQRIRNLEKPVIAAVNGVAAGAGANIALCCDIVIATASASFIQAFSKIGLIPDSSGTFFLPRLIGFQKASALMMLGDKISATEAEKIGMIYKVFSDEEFKEATEKTALQLSQLPTKGLALTKQALNASFTNNLSEQLAIEDKLQQQAAITFDYKEGVDAFLEKRKAVFIGE